MPVTVVAGGQFGSEGKGKVSYELAAQDVAASVRVGGPNSGHTAVHAGQTFALQTLPTPALLPEGDVILAPGSYVSMQKLWAEVDEVGLDTARLHVDPNCVVIGSTEKASESSNAALAAIGSTQSGTGRGVVSRIERSGTLLASEVPELKGFITDTLELQRSILRRGGRVIIEGTQGYGLSLLHSPHYPYVTSRDTTAAGFLAEAGLSPFDVDRIVLVLRTYPIRVAGTSGPLPREVDWAHVAAAAGSPPFEEFTTVTKKVRRVALFDPTMPNRAIQANRPTDVVLNHVDYLDHDCLKTRHISATAWRGLNDIAGKLCAPLTHYGLGPDHLATIAD